MNAAQAEILKQCFHQFAKLAGETLTAFVEVEKEEKRVSNATLPAQTAKPKKGLVNRKEIAELLGVSVRTVSNLISDGLPTVPLGKKRVQFNYDEVLLWLKDRKIKGRAKPKLRVVS